MYVFFPSSSSATADMDPDMLKDADDSSLAGPDESADISIEDDSKPDIGEDSSDSSSLGGDLINDHPSNSRHTLLQARDSDGGTDSGDDEEPEEPSMAPSNTSR